MAQVQLVDLWRVELIESERGWGQRVDETKYFNNLPEAEAYVKEFNSRNTAGVVPDWYMYATEPARVR